MTLQQKILAKQSKKGFTLVELVVVIAILAILAAIAIPAVIGIINSATQSAGASDASNLHNACKTVYSGVKSGTITTSDKDAAGSPCSWAAAPNASSTDRTTKANAVTIDQVQAYNGTAISLDDMYYVTTADKSKNVTVGTIVFSDTGKAPDGITATKLTDKTSLGTIYGKAATSPSP